VKLPRRKFLHLAAGTAALPITARIALALDYPARPVRIIVGFAPAGGTDIIGRLVGQWLSEQLGQQFVIENRPGAASNIGTEMVVNAPPDGYTLLVATFVNAVNATLYDNLNFNFIRDIAPVASIAREPFAIEFKMMTGVNLVHVPYRGAGPALVDLLGGQVQVMFASMSSSIEYVRAGKVRALAVTIATRTPVLPDLPTLAEFVPGYEFSFWSGIGAPRNTPAEIVDKLNTEINAALAEPKMKARLAEWGATALPGSPADFGKLIAVETEKWGKVVEFTGAKPD